MSKISWNKVSEASGFNLEKGRVVEKPTDDENHFRMKVRKSGNSIVIDSKSSKAKSKLFVRDKSGNKELATIEAGSITEIDISDLGSKLLIEIKTSSQNTNPVIIDSVSITNKSTMPENIFSLLPSKKKIGLAFLLVGVILGGFLFTGIDNVNKSNPSIDNVNKSNPSNTENSDYDGVVTGDTNPYSVELPTIETEGPSSPLDNDFLNLSYRNSYKNMNNVYIKGEKSGEYSFEEYRINKSTYLNTLDGKTLDDEDYIQKMYARNGQKTIMLNFKGQQKEIKQKDIGRGTSVATRLPTAIIRGIGYKKKSKNVYEPLPGLYRIENLGIYLVHTAEGELKVNNNGTPIFINMTFYRSSDISELNQDIIKEAYNEKSMEEFIRDVVKEETASNKKELISKIKQKLKSDGIGGKEYEKETGMESVKWEDVKNFEDKRKELVIFFLAYHPDNIKSSFYKEAIDKEDLKGGTYKLNVENYNGSIEEPSWVP